MSHRARALRNFCIAAFWWSPFSWRSGFMFTGLFAPLNAPIAISTPMSVKAWTKRGGWEPSKKNWTGQRRRKAMGRPIVETIFFGGGTPSLMTGQSVGRILEKISRNWRMANDVEITLEANPASADAARFCRLPGGGGQPAVAGHAGAE